MTTQTEGMNNTWTASRLRQLLSTCWGADSVVVLANRQPVRHEWTADGGIAVRRSSGGLVTALEPVIEATAGVWVAHGAGTADRVVVDGHDGVLVPPRNPRYRLRRVWLDAAEERHYYQGFANEALWPVCHRAQVEPVFRPLDFETYRSVNARFADAVCEEIDSDRPLVLVQDYHFALAPRMIRQRLPHATIAGFWHIPWPAEQELAACPWTRELVEGLLGCTLLGFQTPRDCRNFLESARTLRIRVDRRNQTVACGGRRTAVRDYPVSIEWPNRWMRQAPAVEFCRGSVRHQLGIGADVRLVVGVDRLDYTKGLAQKFLAVERLLEKRPDLRGTFALVQIAEPSRQHLPAYRACRRGIVALADRINRRFGNDAHQPIVLLESHFDPPDVFRFLRAADVCYVGSLHDGMNLVAKEFVCARDDARGVLVLSEFAGSSQELGAALIVDPHAIDACAATLAAALEMPPHEQAGRMWSMRAIVASRNGYRWAGELITDAAALREQAPARLKTSHASDAAASGAPPG